MLRDGEEGWRYWEVWAKLGRYGEVWGGVVSRYCIEVLKVVGCGEVLGGAVWHGEV